MSVKGLVKRELSIIIMAWLLINHWFSLILGEFPILKIQVKNGNQTIKAQFIEIYQIIDLKKLIITMTKLPSNKNHI